LLSRFHQASSGNCYKWRGTGGAGEEGAGGGIPKVAGSGRKREQLCNIVQQFATEKIQRGGSQQIQGGEPVLKGMGSGRFEPPCPPPPPLIRDSTCPRLIIFIYFCSLSNCF